MENGIAFFVLIEGKSAVDFWGVFAMHLSMRERGIKMVSDPVIKRVKF